VEQLTAAELGRTSSYQNSELLKWKNIDLGLFRITTSRCRSVRPIRTGPSDCSLVVAVVAAAAAVVAPTPLCSASTWFSSCSPSVSAWPVWCPAQVRRFLDMKFS
jgi:hypothetical protein